MSVTNEIRDWLGGEPIEPQNATVESECIRWSGRKRIYLEGPSDYEIIALCWFNNDDEIEFVKYEHNEGGCKWVLNQVSEQRGTWGVVDRDSLLSPDHCEVFLESDDSLFRTRNPFSNNILVLSRHELENFLCDTLAIFHIIKNRRKLLDGNTSIPSEVELARELLNILNTTIMIDSACIVFRLYGLEAPFVSGFCCDKKTFRHARRDIENYFSNWSKEFLSIQLEASCQDLGFSWKILLNILNCHTQLYNRLLEFDPGESRSVFERFNSLLRVIDGKRFLCHLRCRFKLSDPIDLDLADWIKNNSKIPTELHDFIRSIRTSGVS